MSDTDMRIKFDLDGLDAIVRVQCLEWQCEHRMLRGYRCNLKNIIINAEGVCRSFKRNPDKVYKQMGKAYPPMRETQVKGAE